MSKITDKRLTSIRGVSRADGLRTNGTLTEGVSENGQPSAGGAVVDGNAAAVAANKAAQDATSPAPINQLKGTVTGEEGKVSYDKSVELVAAATHAVPQLANNKAPALPAMPQVTLESAPKTKGGLINAIYETLLTLDVKDLADVFSKGIAPLAHREPGVGLIGSEPQKQIGTDHPSKVGVQFPGAESNNSSAAGKLSGKPTEAVADAVPTSEPPADKTSGPEAGEATTATDALGTSC